MPDFKFLENTETTLGNVIHCHDVEKIESLNAMRLQNGIGGFSYYNHAGIIRARVWSFCAINFESLHLRGMISPSRRDDLRFLLEEQPQIVHVSFLSSGMLSTYLAVLLLLLIH